MFDITTSQFSFAAEMDSDEFPETTAVVVSHSFRVTECFQHGIRLHDLIFQRRLEFFSLVEKKKFHFHLSLSYVLAIFKLCFS